MPGEPRAISCRSRVNWADGRRISQPVKGLNKVVLNDPNAPDLWARFYVIGSNQPLFVDRDGIARSALADIGFERRNGYAWYGTWPQSLLEKEYPEWKRGFVKL